MFVQDINDFLTIVSQHANDSGDPRYPNQLFYGDQSEALQAYISSGWDCPVFSSDMTKSSYALMVEQTYSNYMDCCANSSYSPDDYPNRNVDALGNPVNITCLLDAVANLTTATTSVIITVRRTSACEYAHADMPALTLTFLYLNS